MDKLQIFNNPEFGEVRTFIEPDGTVLFCGNDIARILGYASPKDAVARHCKGALKRRLLTDGGNQLTNFIPEGDVYRLMYKAAEQSTSPEIKERAEHFGGWIFDEVLPSIRLTGGYIAQEALPAPVEPVTALNEMAKILIPMFDRVGMKPEFQILAMKQIYRKAGIELPVESLTAERELYDIGTIAKRAGVFSQSGKPHVQAVGCILRKLEIPEGEKELVSFEKNGHMGTTYQYTANVAELVKGWIKAQGFPEAIASEDGTRQYKVSYEN